MIEAVFPSSTHRAARRVGLVALLLGVFAVVFFPDSNTAGMRCLSAISCAALRDGSATATTPRPSWCPSSR